MEETGPFEKYGGSQGAMPERELMIDRIRVRGGVPSSDMRHFHSPMCSTQQVHQIIEEKFGGKENLGNKILAQAISKRRQRQTIGG